MEDSSVDRSAASPQEADYGSIDVPPRPTTDEEIEALPVLDLDKFTAEQPAATTRVTIGPSPFVVWLGWTWTRSRYGRTIQWP